MHFYYLSIYLLLTSVLQPHSEQAKSTYNLLMYFFIAAGFMLALVSVLTIVFLRKYRYKNGDKEPPQIKGNKKAEFFMISVPLLMVIFFFILTVRDMSKILPDDEGLQPDVIITAHQWWWQVDYPGTGVSTSNEIHLPVGRKILLHFLSADVIHDWWVPELGNKMDIIPGRINHLWLTINEPGHYTGSCSEFCGDQHARMHIQVFAQSKEEYEKWLSAHKEMAVEPQNDIAAAGANIFRSKTCGNCHTIKGTTAAGTVGPELTHFASRKTLLTGVMENNKQNLDKWLDDPQKIKPGAYMPDFFLDTFSRRALIAYLMELR